MSCKDDLRGGKTFDRYFIECRSHAIGTRLDEAGMVEIRPEFVDGRGACTHFFPGPLDVFVVLAAAGKGAVG